VLSESGLAATSGYGTFRTLRDVRLESGMRSKADDAELLIAVPEHKVSLDDAGRESQSDVFAIVKANNRTIAVTVEGKVKESVGPAIKAWYTRTVTRKTEPVGLPV
jgi:hypothetical protein